MASGVKLNKLAGGELEALKDSLRKVGMAAGESPVAGRILPVLCRPATTPLRVSLAGQIVVADLGVMVADFRVAVTDLGFSVAPVGIGVSQVGRAMVCLDPQQVVRVVRSRHDGNDTGQGARY